MAATTDHVLAYLKDKTAQEIERTLKNLQAMSTAQAEETGAIAARQKAADEKMSLNEVQEKLVKANAAGDLEAIRRWQPLHQEKLKWVTDQMQAREQERVDKINKPAIEKRQARRAELLQELNEITQGTVSGNLDRIEQLSKELEGLS